MSYLIERGAELLASSPSHWLDIGFVGALGPTYFEGLFEKHSSIESSSNAWYLSNDLTLTFLSVLTKIKCGCPSDLVVTSSPHAMMIFCVGDRRHRVMRP
jgi:hypothetical protein